MQPQFLSTAQIFPEGKETFSLRGGDVLAWSKR